MFGQQGVELFAPALDAAPRGEVVRLTGQRVRAGRQLVTVVRHAAMQIRIVGTIFTQHYLFRRECCGSCCSLGSVVVVVVPLFRRRQITAADVRRNGQVRRRDEMIPLMMRMMTDAAADGGI